jgi:LuxR family maltose regulon positive regulatory protein
VNAIAAAARPLVLLLDDYHLIETESVHQSLSFLLDRLPQHAHLVVATRDDPPLGLARRRARGDLLEFRAVDLCFTVDETAEFLRISMGLDLTDEDVAVLEQRTEGWIAGLQLAALSLQQRADRQAFIAHFAGDDRYVMDYLVAEVLHQQPERVQQFLLQTSILERLTAGLCDAVTGRTDSGEFLADLDRANLFVSPQDNRREWYRYHGLFGELLRHRLFQEQDVEQVAALHRRASGWYEAHGWPIEAIQHALAAEDWPRAAALIEQHALPTLFRSESVPALLWMQSLPPEVVQSRPRLSIAYAWSLLMAHPAEPAPVEQRIREAEHALHDSAAGDPLRSMITRHLAAIRAFMARVHQEDPQEAIALSKQALAGLDDHDLRLRGFLTMNLASSYLRLGNAAAALRTFGEARQIGETNEDYYTALVALHRQAYILTKQGRLREAARLCRWALREIAAPAEQQGRPLPAAGALYNALAAVLLEWNDLEGADQALQQGFALLTLTGERRVQVRGYATLARLKQAQGDVTGALDALDQARPLWRRAAAYADALHVQLRLSQAEDNRAELAWAQRWAQEREVALDEADRLPPIYMEDDWHYTERLTLGRLLIAQWRAGERPQSGADLQALLNFLAQQRQLAARGGLNERVIELSLLQALAWQALGEVEPALAALGGALAIAEAEGYVRIFLDHGAPLARLLYRVAEREPERTYVGRLLAAMPELDEGLGPPAVSAEQPPIVEPLTERELEVLHLIAAGLSNREIAVRLTIAHGTVKVHTSRIYGKLNVHSRTQAVQRARELGILPAFPTHIPQI